MSETLRLSDLLARSVTLEWFEAVALVRDVIDRLLERPGAQIVPDLEQIELSHNGKVLVSGGTRTDESVRRLGQLLQAALAQAETPVQLRLLVTQATGSNPPFASVREFATALEYFERPDRAAVLAALHARAASAPMAPGPIETPTLDTVAPLWNPEPWEDAKKNMRGTTRRALWLAAAAIVAFVAVAAAFTIGIPTGKSADEPGIARKASAALGAAVTSGINSVGERTGLGRLVSTGTSAAAAPAPAPVGPPSKPAILRPVRRAAAVPVAAPAPQPENGEPIVVIERLTRGTTPAVTELRSAQLVATSPPIPDERIYSERDDVRAPVTIRPQMPRELPPNVNKNDLARIEILVLPDGRVGSVKLLGPRTVHDSMLLSAVKAWEFKPAIKNGRPVAYRKTIWVAYR